MSIASECMESTAGTAASEDPNGAGLASGGNGRRRPKRLTMRYLRAALRRRPDVLQLVVSLRRLVEKKNILVAKLKTKVKKLKAKSSRKCQDSSSQTDDLEPPTKEIHPAETKESVAAEVYCEPHPDKDPETAEVIGAGWSLGDREGGDGETPQKSLAEQVEEAARSALAQTGMVYVESAGMYYDYKSGYYYNSELGLYYHGSTGCYYYYSEENNEFTYHSHADTRAHTGVHAVTHTTPTPVSLTPETQQLILKKEKLRKRHKKESQEDDEKQGPTEAKRKKRTKKEKNKKKTNYKKKGKLKKSKSKDKDKEMPSIKEKNESINLTSESDDQSNSEETPPMTNNSDVGNEESSIDKRESVNQSVDDGAASPYNQLEAMNRNDRVIVDSDKSELVEQKTEDAEKVMGDAGNVIDNVEVVKENGGIEIEDGECSNTVSEAESDSLDSTSSDSTVTDVDECVSRHHPPCMRVVVRETSLPKLRVGTLFLVTKDGGTLGREGDDHAVLLRDENISRIHLQFMYNMEKRCYEAIDLGSKNGTILNGARMSESQQVSQPIEVVHGSILQVGESKLLCHVHAGSDTCGHCEPGLLMAADEANKRAAYTRTCSVKKQHAIELARLKNRYAPEPLAIEDGSYNDRAKARRDNVGSSHHSEKTQQNSLDTSIATDNKGFQMLAKMGWKEGSGLGREQQGDKEPVPLVSNAGTAGLGAGGAGAPAAVAAIRLHARPRRALRPAASAFRDPLEEDD